MSLLLELVHSDNNLKCKCILKYFIFIRSESPSSQRSSPPISPGCEDQLLDLPMHLHDPFKKPLPPLRAQDFSHFYSGYPYHLIQHGGSAFHRPMDASGKPIPVSFHYYIIFS